MELKTPIRSLAAGAATAVWSMASLAAGPSPYVPKRIEDVRTSVVTAMTMPCTSQVAFGVRLQEPVTASEVTVLKRTRAYAGGPYQVEFQPPSSYFPFAEFDLVETMKSELVWQVHGTAFFRTDELAYEQAMALKAAYETASGLSWVQRKHFGSPTVGSAALSMTFSDVSLTPCFDR